MNTVAKNLRSSSVTHPDFDWHRIARILLQSRAIDHIEETELVPAKLVFNQFSARGHDLAQIALGSLLTHPHDAATGYYRSRPFVLTLGLELEDAIAPCMAKAGGYSDGRDIGVVCNYPNPERDGAILFPMCGGVGAQYTSISGWAQSIRYHCDELGDESYRGAIAIPRCPQMDSGLHLIFPRPTDSPTCSSLRTMATEYLCRKLCKHLAGIRSLISPLIAT